MLPLHDEDENTLAGSDSPAPTPPPSDAAHELPDAADVDESTRAPHAAAAQPGTIADGELHEVDPRYIPAERVGWWIFLVIVAVPSFITLIIGFFLDWFDQPWGLLASAGWILIIGMLLWFTLRWPQLTYKYTRYCVNDSGIEIRKGVLWRSIHNVPRNRVQHTDVRQGPLERRFGIATLTTFTAGTANSSVELNGLAHEQALLIRDYLIAGGEDDAV